MCGIAGIVGAPVDGEALSSAVVRLRHRGPDAEGFYLDPEGAAGLGHCRLSILDLSDSGRQPMADPSGRFHLVFNGEIYNYLELRNELRGRYDFRTRTDTEVLLAAYLRWGATCLDRLIGMFAFAVWDEREKALFAARDRFGVKPLYYHQRGDGTMLFASEIKALHAAGVPREPDEVIWATYLAQGLYDHSGRTCWEGVRALPPGTALSWRDGRLHLQCWYDLADSVGERFDARPEAAVLEEYRALLEESVRLRFRADVPVGLSLSGGLDSSVLLGLVHAVQGEESTVTVFTFCTGDTRYDELPWVRQMLTHTRHPHRACLLSAAEVPELASAVQEHQDGPFGGIPTLAYSKIFAEASAEGVRVVLDGQGMDEQWAGYDYYVRALDPAPAARTETGPVQGSRSRPVRPECLQEDFRARAATLTAPAVFSDRLRNWQYRDARHTKIPRVLRFNDRVSMMHSTELREPFLDHRLFELALRQPAERKIRDGVSKWFLRRVAHDLLPKGVVEAPKRPVQTPQREWLRGPLRDWARSCIDTALNEYGGSWLDRSKVRREWRAYSAGDSDNSFYIWQWVNLGLVVAARYVPPACASQQ